jgi:hypothetical protein
MRSVGRSVDEPVLFWSDSFTLAEKTNSTRAHRPKMIVHGKNAAREGRGDTLATPSPPPGSPRAAVCHRR